MALLTFLGAVALSVVITWACWWILVRVAAWSLGAGRKG